MIHLASSGSNYKRTQRTQNNVKLLLFSDCATLCKQTFCLISTFHVGCCSLAPLGFQTIQPIISVQILHPSSLNVQYNGWNDMLSFLANSFFTLTGGVLQYFNK